MGLFTGAKLKYRTLNFEYRIMKLTSIFGVQHSVFDIKTRKGYVNPPFPSQGRESHKSLHYSCTYGADGVLFDISNGTTTLKLMLRPILNIPGCTPAGTVGLSKYFKLLMLLW